MPEERTVVVDRTDLERVLVDDRLHLRVGQGDQVGGQPIGAHRVRQVLTAVVVGTTSTTPAHDGSVAVLTDEANSITACHAFDVEVAVVHDQPDVLIELIDTAVQRGPRAVVE